MELCQQGMWCILQGRGRHRGPLKTALTWESWVGLDLNTHISYHSSKANSWQCSWICLSWYFYVNEFWRQWTKVQRGESMLLSKARQPAIHRAELLPQPALPCFLVMSRTSAEKMWAANSPVYSSEGYRGHWNLFWLNDLVHRFIEHKRKRKEIRLSFQWCYAAPASWMHHSRLSTSKFLFRDILSLSMKLSRKYCYWGCIAGLETKTSEKRTLEPFMFVFLPPFPTCCQATGWKEC